VGDIRRGAPARRARRHHRAALADPEEAALLTRTESYARTEQLLEIDILKKMAAAAGDDILGS